MLCRLCLIDDTNYQKLEGAICDMLRAVLRKKYMQISDSVLCSRCVKKVENAFEFKTTSLRSQKILSLYGGSDTKVVYVRENKLCVTSKNDNTTKLCKTCLRLIEHNLCINLLGRYDIVDTLKVYIPEVVINDKETSLICHKCSDSFRIFSEIINVANDTENVIIRCCKDKDITDTEKVTLDHLIGTKNASQDSTEDSSIMKLLGDNCLLDLENEFESNNPSEVMEDSKKRIIKKIIEEDVDLFYKEKPDFDLDDPFSEESGIDSDNGNIFFGVQSRQLLLSSFEEDLQYNNLRRNVEESSLRLSFETEDSSLSPGALSDRNFYECEEVQEDGKKDERGDVSPNPFIFFNDYAQNDDRCTCDEGPADVPPQKSKRKCCDKCKWKRVLGYDSETTDSNRDSVDNDTIVKKPKRDGKRKCRKAYGIEFKDLWCTQCRWKKACTRFGNAKAVSRR